MESQPNIPAADVESTRAEASKQFIQHLFDLHPDSELKARMWEIDPETMSELMPEVGTDAFEVPEVAPWRSLARTALNSVRVSMGRWPKEPRSPEKRMHDAWVDFHDTDNYEKTDEDVRLKSVTELIWEDARRVVKSEQYARYRRNLRYRYTSK